LHPFHADLLIARYRWVLLLGLILIVYAQALDGSGVFAGTMAIMLGACGGGFGQYRRESGLWMISGMFLAFSCVALVVLGGVALASGVQAGLPSPSSCDCLAAAAILVLQVSFLAAVTRTNWSQGKKIVSSEV
jgi:hypothetical protein